MDKILIDTMHVEETKKMTKAEEKRLLSAEKVRVKLEAERDRLKEMRIYEEKYADYELICGVDEVGRGPLAGPVFGDQRAWQHHQGDPSPAFGRGLYSHSRV